MEEGESEGIMAELFEMGLYIKSYGFVLGLIRWLKEGGASDEHIEEVLFRLKDE